MGQLTIAYALVLLLGTMAARTPLAAHRHSADHAPMYYDFVHGGVTHIVDRSPVTPEKVSPSGQVVPLKPGVNVVPPGWGITGAPPGSIKPAPGGGYIITIPPNAPGDQSTTFFPPKTEYLFDDGTIYLLRGPQVVEIILPDNTTVGGKPFFHESGQSIAIGWGEASIPGGRAVVLPPGWTLMSSSGREIRDDVSVQPGEGTSAVAAQPQSLPLVFVATGDPIEVPAGGSCRLVNGVSYALPPGWTTKPGPNDTIQFVAPTATPAPDPPHTTVPLFMFQGRPCVPLVGGGYAAIDTGGMTLGIAETLKAGALKPPSRLFKIEGVGDLKPGRDFLAQIPTEHAMQLADCAKPDLTQALADGVKYILGREILLKEQIAVELDFPESLVKFYRPDKKGVWPAEALFNDFPQAWFTADNGQMELNFPNQPNSSGVACIGLDTGWPGCDTVSNTGKFLATGESASYRLCGYDLRIATNAPTDPCYLTASVGGVFGSTAKNGAASGTAQLWGGVALLLPFDHVLIDMPEGLLMAPNVKPRDDDLMQRYLLYSLGLYVDANKGVHAMRWLPTEWSDQLQKGKWSVADFGSPDVVRPPVLVNESGVRLTITGLQVAVGS